MTAPAERTGGAAPGAAPGPHRRPGAARQGATAEYRPQLRPGVLLGDAVLRGDRFVHLVKNTGDGRSFELGPREHHLLSRMDGTRTLAELGRGYAETFGRRLGDGNWTQLLTLLGSRGLLVGGPAADPPEEEAKPSTGTLRMVADADATARRLHRAVGFLLHPLCLLPLLAAVLAMETMLVLRADEVLEGTAATFANPVLITGAALLMWLSTALHELAHGVVAVRFGGTVGEIGLRWKPVPIMYCSVENYLFLPRRRDRIFTAVAGAVANLLFLLPFCALWLFVPVDDATHDGLAGLLLIGTVQALAMLLPLPPLDGYKVVSQAAGATALAASSRDYLRLALRRDPAAKRYPRRARAVYTAYGLGSTAVVAGLAVLAALLVASLFHP
ncbi:M50 family metallopeptidase [Streptomyces sp. RKND-216]|uniref:M50 family metallopeptidase n=1 Tax=Streptomyces sp. RKND-216 TaxID=2562581 RepID=UPI001FF94D2C|nr:M50 family metallopeptidase [Streptomyces sp. RKND-216]